MSVVASIAEAQAFQSTKIAAIPPGHDLVVLDVGSGNGGNVGFFVWKPASTSTDASNQLVITPTGAATGRWHRADPLVDWTFPFTFNTADAAVLGTVPVGFRLRPTRPFWEILANMTGGVSSTIGLSSSNAGFNTKGDLLGGAAGDLAATLVAGLAAGTIGTKVAALGGVYMVAGNTVRFDRITSAFTAGSGIAHLPVEVIAA